MIVTTGHVTYVAAQTSLCPMNNCSVLYSISVQTVHSIQTLESMPVKLYTNLTYKSQIKTQERTVLPNANAPTDWWEGSYLPVFQLSFFHLPSKRLSPDGQQFWSVLLSEFSAD